MRNANKTLYQVSLPYACFGILVGTNDRITHAPPIARWMVGRTLTSVLAWIEQKHGSIVSIE